MFNLLKVFLCSIVLLSMLKIAPVVADEPLAPPRYSLTDKYGVNASTNVGSLSIPTVSIGGEFGLSHIFKTQNSYILRSVYGVNKGIDDQLEGRAFLESIFEQPPTSNATFRYKNKSYSNLFMLSVYSAAGSEKFEIISPTGEIYGDVRQKQISEYSFNPTKDKRNKLERIGEYLVWTAADGTKSYFIVGSYPYADITPAKLRKIEYANGFATYINQGANSSFMHGARTNTGYQIKYQFIPDVSQKAIESNAEPYARLYPNTHTWSLFNPKHIVALNSAVEFCDDTKDVVCQLNHPWQEATIDWPTGMPKKIYTDPIEIKIDTPKGLWRVETELQNLNLTFQSGQGVGTMDRYGDTCKYAAICIIPRIKKITYPGHRSVSIDYLYRDYEIRFDLYKGEQSELDGVRSYLGDHDSYGVFPTQNPYDTQYRGKDIKVFKRGDYLGAIARIENLEGVYEFDLTYENKLRMFTPVADRTQYFEYDVRGNLTKIIYNKGLTTEAYSEAKYADNCTSQNYKYCNKAEWSQDENGNKTYYTYHPESGQLATVTLPANRQNKIAQTRYTYERYFANYYHGDGVKRQASDGVWLKATESYCVNSNYVNGSCEGNDEVVTTYEYNHDNLHMTGMIVRAKDHSGQISEQRTCYEYDIYGNRISETAPKGTGSSCPAQ